MIALSPDGTKLAAAINRGGGAPGLFLRSLDSLELTLVEGGDFAYAPFFSPDGQWIAFHEPGSQKLKKVPVAGGAVQTLCDAYPPLGGAWLEDDTLVFTSQEANSPPSLFRVASTGGEPQSLTDPGPSETHAFPAALPGDRGVLFTRGIQSEQGQTTSIALLDLETGTWTALVEDASLANYAPSGHIVFVRRGALWAVPFDLDSLAVTGPEVLVQDGLEGGLLYTPWALAAQGLLVYSPRVEGSVGGLARLAWLDRQGVESPIEAGSSSFNAPRISHDGRKLAVLVSDIQQLRNDLWVYDLGGRPPIRLTSGMFVSSPVWTPDDSGITFHDNRASLLRTIPSDGSSQLGEVIDLGLAGGIGGPQGWTPDGSELLVSLVAAGRDGSGTHTIVVNETGEQRQLMQTDFHVTSVDLSPDGHWVAYISNATGGFEVYVRPYPGPGPQHRVSANGADAVRWSRDGRELLFRSGPRMMAATFKAGLEPEIGSAVELFNNSTRNWDVAPDGRFLVVLPLDGGNDSTHLVLVDGFLDELRRLAPPAG